MMHKNSIRLAGFIIIAALSKRCSAQAQTRQWTLQQCIEHALTNNIQIKQKELNVTLSKQNLLQNEAALLPSINGSASHNYNFGRTIDPFTNQFATDRVLSQNIGLSSSVTLFRGLSQYNTIRQSQLDYVAGKYDVDKTRNDISLNVAGAYLQILLQEELVKVSQNQADLSRQQLERTQKLVDAGSLARGNVLDMQAQLALEELNVTIAQNQLNIAYLTLAQLLELGTAENFSIVRPDIGIPSETMIASSPGQIYATALETLPEIKSAEISLRSSEKGVAIARGNISPQLTLSGFYGTGYSGASKKVNSVSFDGFKPNGSITSSGDSVLVPAFNTDYSTTPFSEQIDQNLNRSIGLRLTIPIFNGLQTQTSIVRAKIQRQNAELNLQLAKNQLQKSIQQAFADANAALKKYYATKKSVEALEESFKYTEQRFNVGLLNSFDYNDAKNRLIKAQSDLLQAKYDYVFKTKVLDFYQGKPLVF